MQGRVVAQFQLDKAKGVAPAQIIVSFMQGERQAIVLGSAIAGASLPAAIKSAFSRGVKVGSDRFGYTGEIQLPTRYATLTAKYWNGEDLRWFFAGGLFSTYNDTAPLFTLISTEGGPKCVAGTAGTASSIDGSSTVAFGFSDSACTVAATAAQRPIRAQGGFVNLALPLSRIANANPDGRNAGWTLNLHYGIDFAKARDVRRTTTSGVRHKSDLAAVNIMYKLNSWVTFAVEESYYRTRALVDRDSLGNLIRPCPLFAGRNVCAMHNIRTEFATIFTF